MSVNIVWYIALVAGVAYFAYLAHLILHQDERYLQKYKNVEEEGLRKELASARTQLAISGGKSIGYAFLFAFSFIAFFASMYQEVIVGTATSMPEEMVFALTALLSVMEGCDNFKLRSKMKSEIEEKEQANTADN